MMQWKECFVLKFYIGFYVFWCLLAHSALDLVGYVSSPTFSISFKHLYISLIVIPISIPVSFLIFVHSSSMIFSNMTRVEIFSPSPTGLSLFTRRPRSRLRSRPTSSPWSRLGIVGRTWICGEIGFRGDRI